MSEAGRGGAVACWLGTRLLRDSCKRGGVTQQWWGTGRVRGRDSAEGPLAQRPDVSGPQRGFAFPALDLLGAPPWAKARDAPGRQREMSQMRHFLVFSVPGTPGEGDHQSLDKSFPIGIQELCSTCPQSEPISTDVTFITTTVPLE